VVVELEEVDVVECSVELNTFETITPLDFLVNGQIVTDDADFIANGFMVTYNQLSEEYCDSLFRQPDAVLSNDFEITAGPDQNGVSTVRFWLRLQGTCRGCTGSEALFDSNRRRMQQQEEQVCFCYKNSIPRAPTDEEFQEAFASYLGSRRRLQQLQSKFTLLCVGSTCPVIILDDPSMSPVVADSSMSPTIVNLLNPNGAQNFAGCNVAESSFVGDGFCDRDLDGNGLPIYNNVACGYDGGDW
jgi:hypothetical protein